MEPLMSANRKVTTLRSPSNSADAWSAVLWLIDSGNSALTMGGRSNAAPGDVFRGAAHSPQKRAPGEFSNPHFAQSRLNGAAHCSQNFSPSGFSAPHFPQRTRSALPPVKRRRMVEILFDAPVYENRRERGAMTIDVSALYARHDEGRIPINEIAGTIGLREICPPLIG